MFKIGTDIVKISRIEKSLQNELFCKKVFSESENEYAKTAQNYAGLFAAKEAYFKAVGTGIKGNLKKVEILHTKEGKPFFNGIEKSDLSISHDGDYAVATVILWE